MPVDQNGNRADVVIYGGSTIKRMNIGRLYEQFINAASRDLTQRLRTNCGLNPNLQPTQHQLSVIAKDMMLVEMCWNELMEYYQIVAPIQYDLLVDDPNHTRHVLATLEEGIYLYVPPDNPVDNLEMVKTISESKFRPHYGPVTYRDNAGRLITTNKPVLIGSLYMIMLEKTGEDWSGVASVKTNHFGVPSKLNNFDKQTAPGRQQSVRGLGESETRSYISTVGPEATMELLDQSNNPEAHRAVTENIIRAAKPTAIEQVVDRRLIPYGGSRPVGFINHLLACRGVRLVNKTQDDQKE